MMTKKKSQLSASRQHLLVMMSRLNFCRIEHLQIRGGDPVFDPPPTVIQEMKIGGSNDARVEGYLKDFALKQAHLEMFQHFDAIGNGCVEEIAVRFGLPQSLKVKRAVA